PRAGSAAPTRTPPTPPPRLPRVAAHGGGTRGSVAAALPSRRLRRDRRRQRLCASSAPPSNGASSTRRRGTTRPEPSRHSTIRVTPPPSTPPRAPRRGTRSPPRRPRAPRSSELGARSFASEVAQLATHRGQALVHQRAVLGVQPEEHPAERLELAIAAGALRESRVDAPPVGSQHDLREPLRKPREVERRVRHPHVPP